MSFHEERIKQVKEEMEELEIDVLLLYKPQNTYYLSGFNAIIYSRPVMVVLPLEGEPCLIVPRLRVGHAREESRVKDIRIYHKIRMTETRKDIPSDPLDVVKEILEKHNLLKGKIGIEMDYLQIGEFRRIREAFSNVVFKDVTELFQGLRLVKDEEEIEMVRKAAEISDVGMKAAIESVSERVTEIEVSINAMKAMNEYWKENYPGLEVADFGGLEGGIPYALWCYCLSGSKISFGCESPSARKLRDGDTPFIVILATVNGYHVENERMPILGTPTIEQKKAFEAYFEASQKIMDTIRPGITCSQVARVAAEVYERLGYAKYSHARAGHSMGLGGHENPSFALGEETVLQENMVFSVEPSFTVSDEVTVAISNTGVVTKNGFEVLTKYGLNRLLIV